MLRKRTAARKKSMAGVLKGKISAKDIELLRCSDKAAESARHFRGKPNVRLFK